MDSKQEEEELTAQFTDLTLNQVDVNDKEIQKIDKEIEKTEKQIENKEKGKGETLEKSVTIIKGTQRADGSFRKDIKIRAGFKNAEMMGKYVVPQKR